MSKHRQHRPPAAFRLDDSEVIIGPAEGVGRAPRQSAVLVTPEPWPSTPVTSIDSPIQSPRRGFRWGTLFWCAAAGLALVALGLTVTNLIEDLFARSRGLGWIGLVLATIATVSLRAVGVREAIGLLRLATMEIYIGVPLTRF